MAISIKKKKTALEDTLQRIGKTASNVYGGLKQQTSNTFKDFYNRFSQNYDTYKKQQQQRDIIQRQKIGEFAKSAVMGLNTFVNRPFERIGQEAARLNRQIPTKYTPFQRFSISLPRVTELVGKTYGGQIVKPYQWAAGKAAEQYARFTKSPQATTLAKIIQSSLIPETAGRTLGGFTKALISGPISQYNPEMNQFQKAGEAVGTIGALLAPGSSISGGVLNVPFHAILTGLMEKRLINEEEAAGAYSSGIEFTTKLGPLAKVLEGISTPLLSKLGWANTETVKDAIKAYIRYKGTPAEKAAWRTLWTEVVKQTPQRAVAGAVSMGAYGATLPSENSEQFQKNVFDNALQGLVFETVLGGTLPLASAKMAPPPGYSLTMEKPENIAAKRLAELKKKTIDKSITRAEQAEKAFLETRVNDPQAIKEFYKLVEPKDLEQTYGVPTAETQYRRQYNELMPAEDIRAAQDNIQLQKNIKGWQTNPEKYQLLLEQDGKTAATKFTDEQYKIWENYHILEEYRSWGDAQKAGDLIDAQLAKGDIDSAQNVLNKINYAYDDVRTPKFIKVLQDRINQAKPAPPVVEGGVKITVPPTVTDIGITSFRGQPVKTIADSNTYYGTTRAKGFENSLTTKAKDYGLEIKVEKSAGVWEGNLEPSYTVKAKGNINAIRAYAAEHGMKGNQDAVGIFVPDQNGVGFKYELSQIQNPDAVIQNLKNNGISGANFNKKTGVLSIWDMDGSLQNNVVQLSKTTNSLLKVVKGTVEFLEKKDYGRIIQEYQTSTSLPTTATAAKAGGGGNILYQQETRAGTTRATQKGLTVEIVPPTTANLPPKRESLPGQKERGLIESIRENPANLPEVRKGVSGYYDTTTDKGRIAYGEEYVRNMEFKILSDN